MIMCEAGCQSLRETISKRKEAFHVMALVLLALFNLQWVTVKREETSSCF